MDSSRLSDRVFLKRAIVGTTVVAVIAIILFLAWRARLALLVIYLSALVAAGLSRPISALARWHPRWARPMAKWVAALVVYTVLLGAIGLLLTLVLSPFVSQADQFWASVPREFNHFQDTLRHYGLVSRRVTLQEAVQNVPKADALASMNTVLTAGFTAAGLVAGVISVIILSYYLVVQGDGVARYFLRWVPDERRGSVQDALAEAILRIGRWLEGTMLIGAIMGVATATLLGLLGVPYFLVVGLIAALGEAVPMVGPIVAGLVATAVSLTVSPELAVVVCGLFVIIHEIEANILVPKIMEGRVGIGAIAVMCGLLIGWELTGVLGAVVAIPTVAILTVTIEQFFPVQPRSRSQSVRAS